MGTKARAQALDAGLDVVVAALAKGCVGHPNSFLGGSFELRALMLRDRMNRQMMIGFWLSHVAPNPMRAGSQTPSFELNLWKRRLEWS